MDEKNSKRTHWVLLFISSNVVASFDYFANEYHSQEVLNKIRDKSITNNIYRVQDNKSIMCGFYFIVIIGYMVAGKTLLDYSNLLFPNEYKQKAI